MINRVGWPKEFKFRYGEVFELFHAPITRNNVTDYEGAGIGLMLVNSLWYAVGTAFVSTTVSFLVGYVVARFKFKFCNVIYTVVILQMIIPTVGTLPSEIAIAQGLRLYNTVYGMLFMKSYVTGLYFLSFYASLRVIPKDYVEAAYLDGAGNFKVMLQIILPMAFHKKQLGEIYIEMIVDKFREVSGNTYEFEFMLYDDIINIEDNIESIFKNSIIVEIRKTNKIGSLQRQDRIN